MFKSLLVLASLTASCYATTAGTHFQLVFMENGVNFFEGAPLEVHVSNTGNAEATVTVSSATNMCPSETRTVSAGSVVRFDVCYNMRLEPADYWPSFKTVLVESDRDVMVYAYNKELFSADGYYAIPTSELAYSYVLAMFGAANIATQFAISATVADTTVLVTLPSHEGPPVQVNYKGSVYTNGATFELRLSQFETFLGQTHSDLTGTVVQANQPIAVFSSNVRNKDFASSRDHMASQLHATGDWGVKFALSPVPRSTNYGGVVRVIAKKADTLFMVSCDGEPTIAGAILAVGEFDEFVMTSPCVITANNATHPLQVVQMVKSQSEPKIADVADPTMFLLVAESQWLNDSISPALVYQKTGTAYDINYAFLAIANGQESGLRVDGNTISANWTRINGIASSWIDVGAGSHRFTHTSNQDFGVMVYGASDRESYGFALGADLSNSECQESLMIKGDGVDNDCDGADDEELCDGIDDDGDNLVDEDCRIAREEAVGNLYVIMFTMNEVTDNSNAQEFIEVYVSAANVSKDVTYSLTTSLDINRVNQFIPAGDVDIFQDFTKDLLHLGSGISNKAIRIEASEDIVVYGVNKLTYSTDAFLAFPVDVVGMEYYSAHYHPGDDLNEFAFTPVKDDGPTTIMVTMPNNTDENGVVSSSANFGGQRYGPLEVATVVLEYGQTAQFQAASNNDNLNGAYIKSDKPISVFSGNVRAKVDPPTGLRSRDHLVQQLSPVATWGREFVTVPIPRAPDSGDIFFITASVDNTNLDINIKDEAGGSSAVTLTIDTAGSYVRQDISSKEYAHITSDQPVQVFQYVKTTANKDLDKADPAMMMIPPIQQWSRNYQFITPRTGQQGDDLQFLPFENFVMIAIDGNERDGLRLDGGPLPSSDWVGLTGTNYFATNILVSQTLTNRHALTHTNESIMFQALMYGRANRESYALPLGMRLTDSRCSRTTQVPGDGIDNDCDNEIDEEICDNLDNDLDGSIDEDCSDGVVSGHTFYVTYMEHTVDYPQGTNLELYAAVVGDESANIRVQAPLVPFPNYDITAVIQPGEVYSFGFASHLKNEGQGISGKTIFLRSGTGVVVYGVNKEKFSNDAFLVYPESSLGTDHYTCSWSPSTLPTEFAVVATQDNTVVTITLPSGLADILVSANAQDYSSGETFSVTLQRYEVYQAQSVGDLTGTRVQTSIRSAVFSGNVRTNVELSGSRDHLVQQMIPTTAYGNDFNVVPFPGRTVGDILKIVAQDTNTNVSVNGDFYRTINDAGEFLQYQLASTSRITITSSKPVMVVQFVKSQDGRDNPEEADPAMFLVPSNDNFITVATFITPVYSGGRTAGLDYTNYVTIVILGGEQGNVRLNGAELSQETIWDAIGSSGYVTATFTVESGRTHKITTTSSSSFYGRLYGRADRESYAFPIGFRF